MKAIVHVGLKPGVLDPQGKAVAGHTWAGWAIQKSPAPCIGKTIELDIDDTLDTASAKARVKDMCEQLLANTVIESYAFEIAAD